MISIIKIGGSILDSEPDLENFLNHFCAIPGSKILVHGGGKIATELANKLGIPQTMIEGRRVTDSETLKIATMVYGGLINKGLVAKLSSRGNAAIGIFGGDAKFISAHQRPKQEINGQWVDFGFVGDIDSINVEPINQWLSQGLIPVIAPLTCDSTSGQILNTNADTVAALLAVSLSKTSAVNLIFGFEREGILLEPKNPKSAIVPSLSYEGFAELKGNQVISNGMIPKLDNAFHAVKNGVGLVVIGKAQALPSLMNGTSGTRLTQ